MTATLRDWGAVLDGWYDPSWAEDWDAVGLVCGDLDAEVHTALFAVDPTPEVIAEARAAGAGLVVAHHPLLLHGVHGVDESSPKGRLLAELVRSGPALLTAHTNADVACPGVSDALAAALGLVDVVPLVPTPPDRSVKLVVFVPDDHLAAVVDALSSAGAGAIGDYTRCYWTTAGRGSFVPQPGADPAVGEVGETADVAEQRVEMILPAAQVDGVVRALRAAHPYEEPAYDLLPTMLPHGRGHGRVGELAAPVPAGDFIEQVRRSLPATPAGVRLAGEPTLEVRRVAVCGGAGDDFVDDAIRAGADVYVTADLRHHVAAEAVERGLLLVDAGHWATEWPWLADAAERTKSTLADRGHTVSTVTSTIVTDPWTCAPRA
ncbi:MAG TPA: Nif3-like dinuclear metal center hexameric protein [Mycobacteriales bacterium]|nr:Nif3-like dinuclear metal center hexameric protein [Mycobacteriales bacterium]